MQQGGLEPRENTGQQGDRSIKPLGRLAYPMPVRPVAHQLQLLRHALFWGRPFWRSLIGDENRPCGCRGLGAGEANGDSVPTGIREGIALSSDPRIVSDSRKREDADP